MRSLVFALIFHACCGLFAAENPLLARLNSPLPGSSTVSVQIGAREFSRVEWLDANGKAVNNGGTVLMPDADGVTKSVKGFRFELDLLWQASPRNLLEISLPYYNQEFSPYSPGQVLPNSLDNASVRRADASGDVAFGWRGLILGQPRDPYRAGLGVDFSIPTGQGPFSSAHPLVATGLGGMALAASLDIEGGAGAWTDWARFRAPYEFGYNADIAPGAFVAYAQDQPPQTLAGGRAWVSRAPSYDMTVGVGWDWYRSPLSLHSLALEVQLDQQGAMRLDGAEVPHSNSMELDFVPEARFSFDGVLALNFGWITPFGTAANRAVANWGEILVRADYAL